MPTKSSNAKKPAEQVLKDIRRATRRHFSSEDKIRIVLDGLRGEDSIAELCRRKGLPRASTTHGRRNSWKPASGGWRATLHALLRAAKCRTFAARRVP